MYEGLKFLWAPQGFMCISFLTFSMYIVISKIAFIPTNLVQPGNITRVFTVEGLASLRDFSSRPKSRKKILIWNSIQGLEAGTGLFDDVQCPYTCEITEDQSELEGADSIVVNAFYLDSHLHGSFTLPTRKSTSQIFAMYLMENPFRSLPGIFEQPFEDLFNLTITYLEDERTDIVCPYGVVEKRNVADPTAIPDFEIVMNKTKLVVWLVSNCGAPSSRYEYANLLSKHIQVDVYGKCGNLTCPGDRPVDCIRHIDQQYLFYLAFENGHCKDYATEKVFRTLRDTNLVPVVLGGADYSRILPAQSYIDVRDYKSPKELAEHLNYLVQHPKEYMKYLRWKQDFEVINVEATKRRSFCELCTILHNASYPFKSGFSAREYWDPGVCQIGNEERTAFHIL